MHEHLPSQRGIHDLVPTVFPLLLKAKGQATVYHQGRRHEGILHSLAIFYFQNACAVLEGFEPSWWSTGSGDRISPSSDKVPWDAHLV